MTFRHSPACALAAQTPAPAAPDAAPGTERAMALSSTAPADLAFANALVIGDGVAGVAAYGLAKWREDGFASRLATENEGWSGQDTRYGGADKAGHAYSACFGVRVLSALLQNYGNDRRHAGDLAFWSTLGTLAAVEVADGFSKQYKFSAQDFAINVVGAAFGWCAEGDPAVDDLLDFRLYYRRSSESDSWDAFGDYSGQRCLLVAKASSVPQPRDKPVLRHLELAVGYGTKGYDSPPDVPRKRNAYVGLQLNLSALPHDTVYRDNRWPAAKRATDVVPDLWQIPGIGVYVKSTP